MLLKRCIFAAPLPATALFIIFTTPLSHFLAKLLVWYCTILHKNRTKCRSLHTVLPALFQIGQWILSVGSFFWGGEGAGSISFFGVDFMVKLLKKPTAGNKFWKIGNSPCFWQFSLGWSPLTLPPPDDPRACGTRIHDPLYFYSYLKLANLGFKRGTCVEFLVVILDYF